uniref:Uncharacterized protein n=1 Tax=uncultured marine virus TaxID=186617 RepID=A0A0F7L8K7_9VIRU|nr:hypothetical protein [uncultured marine virus]
MIQGALFLLPLEKTSCIMARSLVIVFYGKYTRAIRSDLYQSLGRKSPRGGRKSEY